MNFKKYFEYASNIGFTDVEFKVQSNKNLSIGVFHKKVEEYTVSRCETYNIRGIYNGNMVSGSTENKDSICAILDQMKENASIIEIKKDQEIFAGSDKYRRKKTYSDELANVSIADKIAMCLELEQKCFDFDERIVEVSNCGYREEEKALTIVNSKGLKLSYKTNSGAFIVGVVAKEGDDIKASFNFKQGQSLKDFDLDEIAKDACEDTIKSLNAIQCKSGKYKAILSPGVFATFLGCYLMSLSGDAVNKGKSLSKDSLNQMVASKKLTVIEDPFTNEYPFLGRTFDDEGVATSKKTIIDKGELKTFLYNIEAAKEANVQSTGNGYGSSEINVGISYVTVKPGRKDLDALAASVKKGIYITNVEGTHAGMNTLSGNFSLQASGYLIEDGKIGTPVNLITIAGNVYDLLKDIREVGNDNKLTRGDINAPSVVIGKLSVSGK